MSTATGIPDLLRRFVPTPYRFWIVLASTIVRFETNDQELLRAFRTRADQLLAGLASSVKSWSWKIIRDYDVSHDTDELFLLSGETLSTLFLGTGTVVAIDWNRGELLGFVASEITAKCFLDMLLGVAQKDHLHYERGPITEPSCIPKPA
jgi:hypothetical protein